jgi:hypothetical protein
VASFDSFKRRDTEEARQFWDAVERNRQLVAAWPDWMKRGSVGESLVRELDKGLLTPLAEAPAPQK